MKVLVKVVSACRGFASTFIGGESTYGIRESAWVGGHDRAGPGLWREIRMLTDAVKVLVEAVRVFERLRECLKGCDQEYLKGCESI